MEVTQQPVHRDGARQLASHVASAFANLGSGVLHEGGHVAEGITPNLAGQTSNRVRKWYVSRCIVCNVFLQATTPESSPTGNEFIRLRARDRQTLQESTSWAYRPVGCFPYCSTDRTTRPSLARVRVFSLGRQARLRVVWPHRPLFPTPPSSSFFGRSSLNRKATFWVLAHRGQSTYQAGLVYNPTGTKRDPPNEGRSLASLNVGRRRRGQRQTP